MKPGDKVMVISHGDEICGRLNCKLEHSLIETILVGIDSKTVDLLNCCVLDKNGWDSDLIVIGTLDDPEFAKQFIPQKMYWVTTKSISPIDSIKSAKLAKSIASGHFCADCGNFAHMAELNRGELFVCFGCRSSNSWKWK